MRRKRIAEGIGVSLDPLQRSTRISTLGRARSLSYSHIFLLLFFILNRQFTPIRGQTTNASCTATTSTAWLFNSGGESPCLVWSKIQSLCLPATSYINVPPLEDGSWSYNAPSTRSTRCQCNVVSYSLMAGCTYCQFPEATIPSEDDWSASCPTYDDEGLGFAENVEIIPAWAYQLWSGAVWGASIVSTVTISPSPTTYSTTLSRDFPSLATTSPSSLVATTTSSLTASPSGKSTTSSTTSTLSPTASSSSSASQTTKWAPVVGGIGGGMVGLIFIFVLIRWYRNRNVKRPRGPIEEESISPFNIGGGGTISSYTTRGGVAGGTRAGGLMSPGLGKGGYGPSLGTKVRDKGKKKKKKRISYPYPEKPRPSGPDDKGKSFLNILVGPSSHPSTSSSKGKEREGVKKEKKKGGKLEKTKPGIKDRSSSFFADEAFAAPRAAPPPPVTPPLLSDTKENTVLPNRGSGRSIEDGVAPAYAIIQRDGPRPGSYGSSVLDLADMRVQRPFMPRESGLSSRSMNMEEGDMAGRSGFEHVRDDYLRSGGTYTARGPGLEVDLSSSDSSPSVGAEHHIPNEGGRRRELIPASKDFSRAASEVGTLPSLYEPFTGAGTWTQSVMESPVSHYPPGAMVERDRRASEGTIGAALGSGARPRESYWANTSGGDGMGGQIPELPTSGNGDLR